MPTTATCLPCLLSAALLTVGPQVDRQFDQQLDNDPVINSRPFTLFNPTPPSQRRPIPADRPDLTESPRTVDPGAVQLEISFAEYTKNGGDHTLAIAPALLKIGLFEHTDIQFGFTPYLRQDLRGEGTNDGIGDLEIRLKINFWGNDDGATAFGFMPFIKIPTASSDLGNGAVEGGLIFPYLVELADGIDLGVMLQTDFVRNDGGGYDVDFIHSAALGFELTEQIGWYIEGAGMQVFRSGEQYRTLLGTGLTFAASDDLIFDVGVNLGLTGGMDDVQLFTGMIIRF